MRLKTRAGRIFRRLPRMVIFTGTVYITGFFCGCSTGKNTGGTRAYHGLTTRYNIFFNAEDMYLDILNERYENRREDYSLLLPFYPTLSDEEKSASGGPFDPVIDKTGKAILEHSISAKPQRDPSKAHSQEYRQWLRRNEFNPFLKNVWLLRGKAFLQNGNFDEAISVFSGMLRLFDYDTPLTDETEIWMLRTYTEMGRTDEAERTIYALKNRVLPNNLEKLFTEHYTYYLIRQREFPNAIPFLRKIIAKETDHLQKKRLQFILGQIYAMSGEERKAFRAFEEVKGLTTPFALSLNAAVWQSTLTSGEQQRKIIREIKKMEQKIPHTDSLSFAEQRYKIYLMSGNDSLARVFRPSATENDPVLEKSMAAGKNMATGKEIEIGENPASEDIDSIAANNFRRLFQGRDLAENAALHRQWRSWPMVAKSADEEVGKDLAGEIEREREAGSIVVKSDVSQWESQLTEQKKESEADKEVVVEAAAGSKTDWEEGKEVANKTEKGEEKETVGKTEKEEEIPNRPIPVLEIERETPEALKQRLERNAAEALRQQQETAPGKSREKLLKEREKQREKQIKQRERELKERQRQREAMLKQREKEREQKLKKQQ